MFRYYSTLRPITPGAYPKPADIEVALRNIGIFLK